MSSSAANFIDLTGIEDDCLGESYPIDASTSTTFRLPPTTSACLICIEQNQITIRSSAKTRLSPSVADHSRSSNTEPRATLTSNGSVSSKTPKTKKRKAKSTRTSKSDRLASPTPPTPISPPASIAGDGPSASKRPKRNTDVDSFPALQPALLESVPAPQPALPEIVTPIADESQGKASWLVEAIVKGASIFERSPHLQDTWAASLNTIAPDNCRSHEAIEERYEKRMEESASRVWESQFLYGCISMVVASETRRRWVHVPNISSKKYRCRLLATLMCHLINALAKAGCCGIALNILPALAAASTSSIFTISQMTKQGWSQRTIKDRTREVATQLVLHEDQGWRKIDRRFILDPVEKCCYDDEQYENVRTRLGLIEGLPRVERPEPGRQASPAVTSQCLPAAASPTLSNETTQTVHMSDVPLPSETAQADHMGDVLLSSGTIQTVQMSDIQMWQDFPQTDLVPIFEFLNYPDEATTSDTPQ